jgi:hypothetical protein
LGAHPCRVFRDRVGTLTLLLFRSDCESLRPEIPGRMDGQIPSHTTPTPHKQIKSFLAGVSRLG